MPDAATWLSFLAAVLAMQLVPGPDTLLITGRGVGEGRKIALAAVLGMTVLAAVVQLPLLAFGLGTAIAGFPLLLDVLRWAGAAYLIWLGLRLLFTRDRSSVPRSIGPTPGPMAAAWQGMTCTLLNPSPMLFMLALLPQFVEPARGSVTVQLLVLGTVQKLSGALVLGATALVAGAAGDWLSRHRRWLGWQHRASGAVMVALGLRLLLGSGSRPS
jgi:threonine/homoserine/homoserine lactone efflux protein